MARSSEDLLLAWMSLNGAVPTSGWQAIALPSAGPVAVQAGRRSPDNAEAVLFDFPSARLAPSQKLPEGQGFAIERADSESAAQLRLAMTRRNTGSPELFLTMACDVIGALDDAVTSESSEATLLRIFIGRVSAWQEFMRKGTQTLGPEAEIGLVGEIKVLGTIIDAGVPVAMAIESWVGPLDGVQDFELGTGALEVKSTLSVAGFPAQVGSLEQLDDSIRQPLMLVGTRLRQIESGQTLPDLVAAMREITKGDPEATRLLGERLIAAGYFDSHADRYIRRFTLLDTRIMEVKAGFPRLTRGNIPIGITRASYEINLDQASADTVTIADALKKLGAK